MRKLRGNGRWPGRPRAEGGGDQGRSQDWRGWLCQPLSELYLYAGGDWKSVKGLEKGVNFGGYWIYIWAPSPVQAVGPEASSPSLSSTASGYGISRLKNQEMVELEADRDRCPESGPSVFPSQSPPSEVQVPQACLLQMLLTTPSPLDPTKHPSPRGRLPCTAPSPLTPQAQ